MVFISRKNKALDTQTQASERGSLQADGESEDGNEIPEHAPAKVASPSERSQVNNTLLTDYKFGIADRLLETVATKTPSHMKRSPDLVPLSKQFDTMRKRLRQMIATAKRYHESMAALDKDRMQVRRRFAVLF
jgi:hypothetical protein